MKSGVKEFLFWDYIDDLSICDKIINFFISSDQKHKGAFTTRLNGEVIITVNTKTKDSTDMTALGNEEIYHEYASQLQIIVEKYKKMFPFCDYHSPWRMTNPFNIQHYAPGQAYHKWHTERGTAAEPAGSRHLVFMTYLNDVYDEGQTEWFHQQIKLTPRKGLTAIWPADWTYTHRGIVSKTEHKYIVTGWFNFVV